MPLTMITTHGLAYLTGDEPGIGGLLKQHATDFVVDEIGLPEFTGDGDFLYLYVEKTGRLTTDVVRHFAMHFDVEPDDVGYAGLKDKHAVTRQWFSIPGATEEAAAEFHDDHMRILDADRHDQPLIRGRLRGNRFEIKVRGVDAIDALRARRTLDKLVAAGAPNFIGEQRFGYRDNNHLQGRALLKGDLKTFLDLLLGQPHQSEPGVNQQARQAYDSGDYQYALELWPTVHRFERQALGPLSRGAPPADAVNNIDKAHRTLLVSAFQSAIFNQVLNDRLTRGMLATLVPGDLAIKTDTHGIFEVRDVATEQLRADRLEISPTGPMWGRLMGRAGGEVGQWELDALAEAGVTEEDLHRETPNTPDGSRRPLRMAITNPQISGGADEWGPYVCAKFDLSRGCFATVVMREIMKPDQSKVQGPKPHATTEEG